MNNEFFDSAEYFAEKFIGDLKNLRGNFIEEILREEIKSGCYGEAAKNFFSALKDTEQDLILRALKLQELSSGRRLSLRLAVYSLFPDGQLVFNEGKFLLWLPCKESAATLNKIELIKILFMDFSNAELDIYFGRSFGMFGSPQTLLLDEVILY